MSDNRTFQLHGVTIRVVDEMPDSMAFIVPLPAERPVDGRAFEEFKLWLLSEICKPYALHAADIVQNSRP